MATASTRVPKGSPTRWATTSAWWTEAITVPISAIAQAATSSVPPGIVNRAARRPAAAVGNSQDQRGIWTLGSGRRGSAVRAGRRNRRADSAGQGRVRWAGRPRGYQNRAWCGPLPRSQCPRCNGRRGPPGATQGTATSPGSVSGRRPMAARTPLLTGTDLASGLWNPCPIQAPARPLQPHGGPWTMPSLGLGRRGPPGLGASMPALRPQAL